MSLNVFILGINGFIGSSLLERCLAETPWKIIGLDKLTDKISQFLDNPRLEFRQGDLCEEMRWIEEKIQVCDVVLPLAAIATPASYVENPLQVFKLDFEANLQIVRLCVKYKKRVVFPSTSEVYGMCTDQQFDEQTSNLVLGPVHKTRWIYACSKQLLDRVIYAYGSKNELAYTLFRPFNWLGPKLDNPYNPKPGGSRVVSQFIGNILRGEPILLVNGGLQQRSFIDIDDGLTALLKIIENKEDCADQRIFNIGHPGNNISIRDLASLLLIQLESYPKYKELSQNVVLQTISSSHYYGEGYQDVEKRIPSIENAQHYLHWRPCITIETSLKKILDYYLAQ